MRRVFDPEASLHDVDVQVGLFVMKDPSLLLPAGCQSLLLLLAS